jgi:outer membrane receptor for ferrienterochelin and colicins
MQLRLDGMDEYMLDRGIPIVPYSESAIDQEFRTQRADQVLSYRRAFNDKNKFNLLLANNIFYRTKNKLLKDLVEMESILLPEASEQDTQAYFSQTVRAIYSWIPNKKWSYQGGLDMLRETVSGPRIYQESQTIVDGGFYATAIYSPTIKCNIKPSVRYNFNSNFDAIPVAQLQFRYTPGIRSVFKGSFGTGYRAPSVKELYLNLVDNSHNVVGNTALKPETSSHLRLSWSYSIPMRNNLNLKPEIELFDNSIDDQIQLVATDAISAVYSNVANFRSSGFNVTIPLYGKTINTSVAYSAMVIDNGLSDNIQDPIHDVAVNASWFKKNTSVSVFAKRQGSRVILSADEEGGVYEWVQEGYTFLDISLGQKDLLLKGLNLTIGLKNALDVTLVNSQTLGTAHSAGSNVQSIANGRQIFSQLVYQIGKKK